MQWCAGRHDLGCGEAFWKHLTNSLLSCPGHDGWCELGYPCRCTPVGHAGSAVSCRFFFYLAFTILALLNINTGACVDTSVETARTQRVKLFEKELELKEQYAKQMRSLFGAMTTNRSGTLNYAEFHEYSQDPRVQGYLSALGLEANDAERLFAILDANNSGDVDVGEFLDGCLRIKGNARSMDVYTMMRDLKILDGRVKALCKSVDKFLLFL